MTDEEKMVFDTNLRKQAELYSSLRVQNSIGQMLVLQVERGTFQKLREALVKRAQNQQVKMPRVLREKQLLKMLIESMHI